MQEVYQNIYLINLPLQQNPLKSLNSYLIKGCQGERNLLVDTGFNHPETEAVLLAALKELGVPLEETDIFLTHAHADHSGLAGKLKNAYNTVYCSSKENVVLRDHIGDRYWEDLVKKQRFMAFPYVFSYTDHPGYCNKNTVPYERAIKDPGDKLALSKFEFEIVDFGGHTPGQIGLYEKRHRIMFSGDHLLHKITPNLKFWSLDYDSLGTYLNSLGTMENFIVDHLFTAHRDPIPDMRERIGQMQYHHEKRLEKCMEIISEKPSSAWAVASGIPWDYLGGAFDKFPPPQQWFAANEAIVHLQHLFMTRSDVERQEIGDVFYYSLK